MSFEEFSQKTNSEKITLAHLEPTKRLANWTVYSGSVYYKDVDFFVINVEENGQELEQESSVSLSASQWYFDAKNKRLYVYISDGSNPAGIHLVVTFRVFFSSKALSLPCDLNAGEEVYYEPLIDKQAEASGGLDHTFAEGVSLEDQSKLYLLNNDGYFSSIFDNYNFENQNASIWVWNDDLSLSDKKKIFSGQITTPSFNENEVTFDLKDFYHSLREKPSLPTFQSGLEVVSDDIYGTPKRRIYGKTSGLKIQPTNMILNGYRLSGNLSGINGSSVISGSGSSFLSQLVQDDEIIGTIANYRVKSVDSNTQITLTDNLKETISGEGYSFKMGVEKGSRSYSVAGHECSEPLAICSSSRAMNRATVDEVRDFFVNDYCYLVSTNEILKIKRISENELIFYQTAQTVTSLVGQAIRRFPVQALSFKGTNFSIGRDFTTTNNTETTLILDDDAELNVATIRLTAGTSVFTNGSREVVGTGTEFTKFLRGRDYIRPVGTFAFYKISHVVDDTHLFISENFSTPTTSSVSFEYKRPEYVDDGSEILATCYGKTSGDQEDELLKYPAQVVRDLIVEVGFESELNEDSFTKSNSTMRYLIDLKIPESPSGNQETYREIITKINLSVFGALYKNTNLEISYSPVYSRKDVNILELNDSDILTWSIKSNKENVIRDTTVRYRISDDGGAQIITKSSDDVRYLVGTAKSQSRDLQVYESVDAEIIAERLRYYSERANATIEIKSKINLINHSIHDQIFVRLDRLYAREGTVDDRIKIGLIGSMKKSDMGCTLVIYDISSIFNKVGNICPDDYVTYSSASDSERYLTGYITDEFGQVDGTFGINHIG